MGILGSATHVKLVDGRPVMATVPKKPGRYNVTYATLQMSGPDYSHYKIYRCKLIVPKGHLPPYVDLHKGTIIGHFTLPGREYAYSPEVFNKAKQAANAEYPAFTW